MKNTIKLSEKNIPRKWFNVLPFLPEPLPPLKDPADDRGSRIALMKKIRLKSSFKQDSSKERWIDIPEDVIEKYIEIGRPTPLTRARNLEKYLGTPARIYVKREDLLPTASFKLNTSIAQAYFAKKEGVKGLVSETGAGQWGLGLAYACNIYGLKCVIFWVKISLEQKMHRAAFTELLGGKIYASPSTATEVGKKVLSKDPNNYGSIGTGIGEAISFTRAVGVKS